MKILLIIAVLIAVSIIMYITINAVNHPCIKSHTVMVHHASYTSYMQQKVGGVKMQTPQYHPAYDSQNIVCDKYK